MTNPWLGKEFSEQYADRSSSHQQDWYEIEITFPEMLSLMPEDTNTHILDYGCGPADYTYELSKTYPNIVGTDISPAMIDLNRAKFPTLETFVWNFEDPFPTNQKFDVVFSKLVVHFISDLDLFAKTMNNLLDQNGIIIISVVHPNHSRKKSGKYFENTSYTREISGMDDKLTFIHRSFQSYIEPFLANGFVLTGIKEPSVPKSITTKYNVPRVKMNSPRRLILRFQKT